MRFGEHRGWEAIAAMLHGGLGLCGTGAPIETPLSSGMGSNAFAVIHGNTLQMYMSSSILRPVAHKCKGIKAIVPILG